MLGYDAEDLDNFCAACGAVLQLQTVGRGPSGLRGTDMADTKVKTECFYILEGACKAMKQTS